MKLINPLQFPLAMASGAGVVLAGVMFGHMPATPMLAVGVFVSFVAAGVQNKLSQQVPERVQKQLKAQLKETLSIGSVEKALPTSHQKVLDEALALKSRADELRAQALERLDGAHQLDLLGTLMYACDRAGELPDRLRPMLQRMASEKPVASTLELQQKVQEAEALRAGAKGKAREELERLIATRQVNLRMAEQDGEARDAQLMALSTAVEEATGVLLSLQTRLLRSNLESVEETRALKRLGEEFQGVDERLGALMVQ